MATNGVTLAGRHQQIPMAISINWNSLPFNLFDCVPWWSPPFPPPPFFFFFFLLPSISGYWFPIWFGNFRRRQVAMMIAIWLLLLISGERRVREKFEQFNFSSLIIMMILFPVFISPPPLESFSILFSFWISKYQFVLLFFFFKLILIFLIICSFLKSLFLVIRMLLLPVASGNVKTDAQRRRALSLTCVSPGHSIKLDSGVEIRFHRNPRHFRLVTSGPPPEADTGNDRNSTQKHLQELSTMEDGTLPVYFRLTSGPLTGSDRNFNPKTFCRRCWWLTRVHFRLFMAGPDREWPEVTGTRTPRRWWLSGVDKCPGGENAGSADRWLALGLGGAAPVTSSIPVFPLMNLFYFSIENCNRAALIVDWQLIHDFRLPRSSPLLVIGSHAPPSSFISFRFIIDLIWF